MQKVIDWLKGKKSYLVAAAMAVSGIAELDWGEEAAGGVVQSVIDILTNAQVLAGGGLAALRAGISKAGK
jgi:hypothetical protein